MTEERMCANCANLELPPEGGQCSGCRDSTASRWLPADYYVLRARVKELEGCCDRHITYSAVVSSKLDRISDIMDE